MLRETDNIYSSYILSEYSKIDYLNENVSIDNYDWNIFESFVEKSAHVELLESFELVSSTKNSKNEISHVYEITTLKNLKFEVHLNYFDPEKSLEVAKKREAALNYKNENRLAKNYSDLKKVLETENGMICMIMFKDSSGSTTLTKKVDTVSGLELFRTIRDVVLDSLYKTGYAANVSCFGMRIYNPEKERRLKFYQTLHKKYWSTGLPNSFIDDISEKEENYTLAYFYR